MNKLSSRFNLNESEKNRIRNLHGNYSVINEGMTSALISQGGVWIGELIHKLGYDVEVPSLDVQVAIQFVKTCMGNFVESQETPLISQASRIVDGMANAIFETSKESGISLTPDQTYFLTTVACIRWLNNREGVMEEDISGTCLEEFINTNSLQDWIPHMFVIAGMSPNSPGKDDRITGGM